MKKNLRLIACLPICIIAMTLSAQSYDALWAEVEKAQQSGLPRTAIDYAEKIFRKAAVDKDSGQMLKAYAARSAYRQLMAPDSFYVDLEALEQWAETTATPADRAVLHTLIAQMYSDYADRNRWSLRERTDVDQVAPEDMREWSGNIFVRKTLSHTHAALEDSVLLAGLSSAEYAPFVEQQPASRYFDHNMYQLLSAYGIRSLKMVSALDGDSAVVQAISGIYSNLNRMYSRQNKAGALTLLALDELEWRETDGGLSPDAYRERLDGLIGAYGDREICAEVYLAKARALNGQNRKAEAFRVCAEALRKYPKYERIGALAALQEGILRPSLLVNIDARAYPGDTLAMHVSHANLDGFTVNYYKVKLPAASPALQKEPDDGFYRKHARKVRTERFALVPPADYLQKDTLLRIVAPGAGLYAVQIVPDGKNVLTISRLLSVTALQLLTRGLPENRLETVVLDARSGQPVEGATVRLFTSEKGEMRPAGSVETSADGRATIPWEDKYMYIAAEKGADASMLPRRFYRRNYTFSDENRAESRKLTLLTDRSLYRPGQTVYVKGIAFNQLPDTANVAAGENYTLTLLDPNDKEVSRKELTTNAFGSFAAEFILPTGRLNGLYTVKSSDGGHLSVRVEEYKRPSFEVTIDSQEGAYRLRDTISVTGAVRTYSGVPVRDLPVQYVVTRTLFGWWRGQHYGSDITASGVASLNDSGGFTLPVALKPDDKIDADRGYYTFNVSVTVTDAAGETQTSAATFNVGHCSILLSADVPPRIDKEREIKLTFDATNLNQKPVAAEGEYRLYRFSDYAKKMLSAAPADTGAFTSNTGTVLPAWKSLPTGAYKLVITAKDEQGREAGYEAETILFSVDDKRPVEGVGLWYHSINQDFDASHPAEFLFGTSEQDAHVLMDVFSGNTRLESRSLHLSDSVVRFVYPYKPEYGDGLTVAFCYVKGGQVYTQEAGLRKRLPEKELKLTWSVFRDNLRPGEQEEWRLTVRNPDGSPADAELLAVMYDASLDQIWKREQQLRVIYPSRLPSATWWFYPANVNRYAFGFDRTRPEFPALAYDSFRVDPLNIQSVGISRALRKESLEELRGNFAETAFFYPQLRTNESGEAVIAFTVPGSLTRWNFNGYAHTKGMLTGTISAEAVARKDFMLAPNLPRFVRVGDDTSVAASVTNLTGNPVSGNVLFTLFDPSTGKIVSTQKQKFIAEAGKNAGVNFVFTATDRYSLLGCRIVAEGGNFSDGEQHLLPVLSRKERVIETVAMPVRGNQTREFPLGNLFNNNSKTSTGRRLTVEFSGNPAWYAVLALPALSLPADDNAIAWATAYYANSLASFVMNSQPRLKAVFDAWKVQGDTKDVFLSNLQKNQELKTILLEESPWLMEATTEQEQKERMSALFDLNNIRNNNITALARLREMQLSSGAWTWYKGMPGSRHITAYVMQLLIRLKALTGQPLDSEATAMYNDAFAYLHREALNEYNALRKTEADGTAVKSLPPAALEYLYYIALSGESVPEANQAAHRYFMEKTTETLATQGITQKALAAVVLHKADRRAEARAFIASLKEYMTQTELQGLFFAFNENPYSWSGLKVPAHVAVMEAFDVVGNDAATLEEMQLWLLKQKQVQAWNSPVATANAVYALLCRGAGLTGSPGDVRIRLGGRTMETLSPSAAAIPGVTYIKERITDKNTLSNLRKVVVEKRDAGMAWGAVYAAYEEETDKVSSYGEGLKVDKKLYVERIAGAKRELLPIASGTQLKVGDKVVSRITIRSDRAMDFVQLKDQRAACFEPVNNLSGYIRGAGTGYYVAVKDASANFYFDALAKGVYVLEHSYRVNRTGTYESGLATIQSAYAPEYSAHAPSVKLKIED